MPMAVRVGYSERHAAPERRSSDPTAAVANANQLPGGAVTISGTATELQTLTANSTLTDTDGVGTFSYQWLRTGVSIGGPTSSSYALTHGDVGKTMTVRVSYTDGYG